MRTKLVAGQRSCPKCGSSWDGGSIVETFIAQRDTNPDSFYAGKTDEQIAEDVMRNYSPPYRWGREIGVEIQGKYDGISYLKCPDCETMFDRFTGEETEMEDILVVRGDTALPD